MVVRSATSLEDETANFLLPVELVTYRTSDALLERIGPALELEEAKHSLILGILASYEKRAYQLTGPPAFAAVEDQGGVVVAAVMTPPFPVILAATEERIPPRAIYSIADFLWRERRPVAGVTGDPWLAGEFAEVWERLSGQKRSSEIQQRIYQLQKLEVPRGADGALRYATEGDVELVGRWLNAFNIGTIAEDDPIRSREVAIQRIAQREIYLWEDSGPRSMVGKSRPTRQTITVNAVYTPPEKRGRGYAAAAVAELSRSLLADGYGACVLYTDLANPTSNRLYLRLGYKPVCDSVRYMFGQEGGPTNYR